MILYSVDLLSYSFHKICLKRGKSYIKPPEWLTNKRATKLLHQTIKTLKTIQKEYQILNPLLINIIGEA